MITSRIAPIFCSTAFLLGCAISAGAATLTFTGSTKGGTIVVGSSQAVTTFTGIPFNSLVIAGAPSDDGTYTITGDTEAFNGGTDTLTLSGTIPSLGINSSIALVTVTLGSGLTGTTNSIKSSFNLNSPSLVNSVSVSSTLLSDIGLAGAVASLNELADTGTGNPKGSGTYQSTSSTLCIDLGTVSPTSVPEPGSGVLMALGLTAIGFSQRKRFCRGR